MRIGPAIAIPGRLARQLASFSPSQIAGLTFWLDAGVGITIATGVSQWNDRSANAFNVTQATGGNQPTFLASDINGRPAVQFVAASSHNLARAASVTVPNQAYTTFCVKKQDTIVTQQTHFSSSASATGLSLSMQPTSIYDVRFLAVASHSSVSTVPTVYEIEEFTRAGTGTANFLKVNGTTVSLGGGTGDMIIGAGIGVGMFASSEFFNGKIAELLVYDSGLSGANASAVRGYLGAKYGITVV